MVYFAIYLRIGNKRPTPIPICLVFYCRLVKNSNTWPAIAKATGRQMNDTQATELVKSLQSQLQSLEKKIQELENENAELSLQLSNCVCKENVTGAKAHVGDETGGPKFHDDVAKRAKDKIRGIDTMVTRHLPKRYVALKVMYFGQRYYGFASEAQIEPTVESEIFKALQNTRLISGDKKELRYSRCGRTDKGVSSVGQIISLFLRSNLKEASESNEFSRETIAKSDGEIDYVMIMNRVLPKDIRIIGWSPAPPDLSARFSCLSRTYNYFFWRENLNIPVMEVAGKKFIGEHDFRNFCKMDAVNVHNYWRHVTSFEILPCNERFEDDELLVVKIRGNAFLWHQIRCMVAVLFLIGQGLESADVIDTLLDVERTQRKPQYSMATELPLVLQSCEFEGLHFKCSSDAKRAVLTHLEKECRSYKLQAAIFHEGLLCSSDVSCDKNEPNTMRRKKESTYVPLMSRQTEPSYEERLAKKTGS